MMLCPKNPIPRGAEFHEHLANSWGEGYARNSFKNRLMHFNSIFDRYVMVGQCWLDLGCGSGVLTAELIKRGASVVALDGSPSMLQAAGKALEKFGSLVSFRVGEVEDLSWSLPKSFDGVLCSSVIEYVEDENELIRQVNYVLKDEGLFIFSVPPKYSLLRVVQKLIRKLFKQLGQNKYSYLEVSRFEMAPSLLADWLKNSNFRLNRISSFDPLIPKTFFAVFRPALLICEATKFKNSTNCDLK